MYRKWRESKGKDGEYIEIIRYPTDSTQTQDTSKVGLEQRRQSSDSEMLFFPSQRKQVLATKDDAKRDGVSVPVTLAEYCVRTKLPPTDHGSNLLCDDPCDSYNSDDEDELDEDDDDDDDSEGHFYDDNDSGTEDS